MRLGPTGYTTDEGAFDAINGGTRQGVIIYQLRDPLLALDATGAAGGAKNNN